MAINKSWSPGKVAGSEKVKVSPELAAHWLTKNAKNRKISDGAVDSLAIDIKDDRWIYDANPIRFNVNGELIDGQHRLAAIARSGKEVECLVAWGLPMDANKNIDCGRARTAKDVLVMRGAVANALQVAAVAKLASCWDKKTGITNKYWSKSSPNQLVEVVENDPSISEAVNWVARSKERKSFASTTVTGFCLWVLRGLAGKAADEFFETAIAGIGLQAGDPRLAMVKTMQRLAGNGSNREFRVTLIALIFKAWNAYRQGEKITLLKWQADEVFPIPVK